MQGERCQFVSMELVQLPEEILLHIFAHLSIIDLAHICQVNHAFRAVGSEEYLWAQLCQKANPFMYRYYAPKLTSNLRRRTKGRRDWFYLMRDVCTATSNWKSGKHFAFALNGTPSSRVTSLLLDYEMVLCGTDSEISCWNAVTGRRLPSLPFDGIPSSLHCDTIAGAGRRLIAGGGDGTVRIYDLQTGTKIAQSLPGEGHAHWVAHLSLNDAALLSSDGSSLVLWDIESMQPLQRQTITDAPRSVASVSDAKLIDNIACVTLLPAQGTPVIRRWDVRMCRRLEEISLPLHSPQSLQLFDGYIISTGRTGRIQLLNWAPGTGVVSRKQILGQLPSHTSISALVMDAKKAVVSAYHRDTPNTQSTSAEAGPAAALYCYDLERAALSWSMEQSARVLMLALDELKCVGLIGDTVKIWNFVWS